MRTPRIVLLVLLAGLGLVLASPALAGVSSPPKPRDAADDPSTCGPPLPGAERVLLPRATVLLGEIHGTDEGPTALAQLVCLAARSHASVIVGLEIPRGEQARIDAFLASAGAPADREALLSPARWLPTFWQRSYQDGRSSEAMVALLESLRALRREGHNVQVVAFDVDGVPKDGHARDASMSAKLLQARTRAPGATLIALAGNLHTKTTPSTPWDPEQIPMALHLTRAGVAVVALQLEHAGGSAWVCTADDNRSCRPRDVKSTPPWNPQRARAIELATTLRDDGHHGAYFVGPLTASPPAAPPAARPPVPRL